MTTPDTATPDTTDEIVQGEPPTLAGPTIRPGYLTTEFWQANIVHLFAAVSSLLVFLNVNIAHLTAIQGAIPLVAMAASLIAQTAYNNKRANMKMHQLNKWGEVNIARLSVLKPLEPLVGTLLKTADPALSNKLFGAIKAVDEGWHEFPTTDVVVVEAAPAVAPTAVDVAPAAPADSTPVSAAAAAPADMTAVDPVT